MNNDFERLWCEYRFELLNFIGKTIRDKETTEELLSVTYSRAWVAMCNGSGYNSNERGWLYQIARNVMNDHFRAMKYKTIVDWDALADRPDDELSPFEAVEKLIICEQVRDAVSRLSATQEDVIDLRLLGYEHGEIAEILGSTEGAIKGVATRAYANLRKWLKEAA